MSSTPSLGTILRAAVPRALARVIGRLSGALDPHAGRSYAQEGEDLVLLRLLEGKPTGFYVDVGAHHPRRFSNTCLFFERGWRGINIDPNPDAIALFERERPEDRNLLVGVSDEPGELRLYRFSDAALNTFDSKLAVERERLSQYRLLDTVQVRVERLDRLLAAHLPAGQTIDFLSVDAEGFDLRVLKSNDWTRYRPHFVLAECLGTTVESALSNALHRYLHDVGYELMSKTLNTLFYCDRSHGG